MDFKNPLNKNPEIPQKYMERIEKCSIVNPGFKIIIWNGYDCRRLLEEYYPFYLQLYDSFDENIKRCDMIRYFILYHYGGFYMDCDRICLKDLSGLLNKYSNYDILLGRLDNYLINNDFIYSKRKSDFMKFCMKNVKDSTNIIRSLNILSTAGPIFLTYQYWTYKGRDKIMIIKKEVNMCTTCSCKADFNDTYTFADISNSSWHKPTERVFNFIICNFRIILFTILFCILVNYVYKYYKCRANCRY